MRPTWLAPRPRPQKLKGLGLGARCGMKSLFSALPSLDCSRSGCETGGALLGLPEHPWVCRKLPRGRRGWLESSCWGHAGFVAAAHAAGKQAWGGARVPGMS